MVYQLIDSEAKLTAALKQVKVSGQVALDLRLSGHRNPLTSEIVGLAMCPSPDHSYYFPFNHTSLLEIQLDRDVALKALKNAISKSQATVVLYDPVVVLIVLKRLNSAIEDHFYDVLTTQHTLHNGRQWGFEPAQMNKIAKRTLALTIPEEKEIVGTGKKRKPYEMLPIAIVGPYAALLAEATLRLHELGQTQLDEKLSEKNQKIDTPLLPVLASMMMAGIGVDLDYLREMEDSVQDSIMVLEAKLHRIAGWKVTVTSHGQISDLLFDQLKLKPAKEPSAKTGNYPVGEGHLSEIVDQHPIVETIIELRQLHYLCSHFINPIKTRTIAGRVHTFWQHKTTSTRITSRDPAVQNITTGMIWGYKPRKALKARKGYKWIRGDYSQIELRILAHVMASQFDDWRYVEHFKAGHDIHAATAATIFGLPLDAITKRQRAVGKAINFAILYGMGLAGLAHSLKISYTEAKVFYDTYMATYPGVKRWSKWQRDFGQTHGYVESPIYGTRRYVEPQEFSVMLNHPFQSGAAEIIRQAMIDIHNWFLGHPLYDGQITIQVHDELNLEVREDQVRMIVPMVKSIMENAVDLVVPLVVDFEVGDNWSEMVEFSA